MASASITVGDGVGVGTEAGSTASMRLALGAPPGSIDGTAVTAAGIAGIATMMTAAMAAPENSERNTLCSPRSLVLPAAPRLLMPRYARGRPRTKCGQSKNDRITRELG